MGLGRDSTAATRTMLPCLPFSRFFFFWGTLALLLWISFSQSLHTTERRAILGAPRLVTISSIHRKPINQRTQSLRTPKHLKQRTAQIQKFGKRIPSHGLEHRIFRLVKDFRIISAILLHCFCYLSDDGTWEDDFSLGAWEEVGVKDFFGGGADVLCSY